MATAENEAMLLSMALSATASQVESLVRAARRAEDVAAKLADPEASYEARYLRLHREWDGSLRIEGLLPPELGAVRYQDRARCLGQDHL